MKKFFWIAGMALFLLLAGCFSNSEKNSTSAIGVSVDERHEGMLFIEATGKSVMLGSSDRSVKAEERPAMKVNFDYDFSIGVHEVTCSEFNRLMKEGGGAKVSVSCKKDNLPAAEITFYDAVLYANALSRSESLDTAYAYSKATFDDAGHCLLLDGLTLNPQVEAYRLPTEAEWTLVAKESWNPEQSWNAENADYKTHEVCSSAADDRQGGIHPCDMAGNVLEWTNDWLTYFRDTVVTDFLGASVGNGVGERVVKGGSFRNAPENMQLYNRGDVYTVTSSTMANYVGFRLALGSIPKPMWLSPDGSACESRVVPLANAASVKAVTGTFHTKLAFRNDVNGRLAYIDYFKGQLSVTEIQDSLEVYHPEISPDGNWVAFCSGLEGVNGPSTLYVRRLEAEGRGLVQLEAESAAIPRWRVLENGDTVIVYVTNAGDNKNDADFKAASTWQVKFSNGKFGKPKKLMDGAYHGGISVDDRLAVSGARRFRARMADKSSTVFKNASDTLWYDGEQACNVSLERNQQKRSLFLDFGGKVGRKFTEADYGTHEMLLVADSKGGLIQGIPAPSGYSFDHSEWVVGDTAASGLAVVTLVNAASAHVKLALLNLADSSLLDLVEGDELWHPSLWVAPHAHAGGENTLDLDSAGMYFTPDGTEASAILRYKMELLWKYKDSANVVILGSSRALGGLSPDWLSKEFFAINLSNVPNSIYISREIYERYVLRHVKNLKYLVVGLDIDFWWKTSSTDNFFYEEFRRYPGYVYDENHGYWADGAPEGMSEAVANSFGLDVFAGHLLPHRGFQEADCADWGGPVEIDYDSTWFKSNPQLFYDSFEQLRFLVESAKNRGAYVIGVIFPQSPLYRKSGAFGRYGLQRSVAEGLIEEIVNLAKQDSHFVLLDENQMGNHDYDADMAQNWDHLCVKGATQLTPRLDSLLRTLK